MKIAESLERRMLLAQVVLDPTFGATGAMNVGANLIVPLENGGVLSAGPGMATRIVGDEIHQFPIKVGTPVVSGSRLFTTRSNEDAGIISLRASGYNLP